MSYVLAELAVTLFLVLALIRLRHAKLKKPPTIITQQWRKPMKQYVPVEPTINAAEITDLQIVTTALLDDGSTVTVPNNTAVGDYVIAGANGNSIAAKADFEAHYKAA